MNFYTRKYKLLDYLKDIKSELAKLIDTMCICSLALAAIATTAACNRKSPRLLSNLCNIIIY